VRGIAGERDAAESPAIDGILVHHRIFENLVGIADQSRYIKPVEAPAFIQRKKVGQIARLVPIILFGGIALDLGHPVNQLVAFGINVIDDRVNHDLAGENRADPHIGTATQDRLAPRHPAPRVDAGERDPVVRVELLS
jgi:hypothetical protein